MFSVYTETCDIHFFEKIRRSSCVEEPLTIVYMLIKASF